MKIRFVNIPTFVKDCIAVVKTQSIDANNDGTPEETVKLVDFREVIAIGGGIALAIVLVLNNNIEEALAIGTTVIGYGIGRTVP